MEFFKKIDNIQLGGLMSPVLANIKNKKQSENKLEVFITISQD